MPRGVAKEGDFTKRLRMCCSDRIFICNLNHNFFLLFCVLIYKGIKDGKSVAPETTQ